MPTIPSPVRHDLAVRRLEVVSVEDLSAHTKRICLGGDALKDLVSLGPTDHIKLIVPRSGGAPELPTLEGGRIRFQPGTRPPLRDYTIRRHRREKREIDIDIAVHGEGHVASWASSRAGVGAMVDTAGPRGSHPMPVAASYALIGDLSSLPAIGRWLEELSPDVTAQVLVAAGGPEDEIELSSPAPLEVHWVHDRSGVPADQLAAALNLLDLSRKDPYVWAAGEVLAMRAVRDRLAGEMGLGEASHGVEGYWRRGQADYDHHLSLDE